MAASHAVSWPMAAAQAAVRASAHFLILIDSHDRILLVNPAAEKILRWGAAELVGQPWQVLLDRGSQSKGQLLIQTARTDGQTREFELNMVAEDGQIQLVGCWAHVVEAGEAKHVLVTGDSLAAKVAGTELLVALNRRLAALFAAAATASRSLVLPDLLQQVLMVITGELEWQAGAIWLAEPPFDLGNQPMIQQLRLAAVHGFGPAFAAEVASGEWFAPWAGTLLSGPHVVRGSAHELSLTLAALPFGLLPHRLQLVLVPLQHENAVIGLLAVLTDRYQELAPAELEVLTSISHLLVIPIENARLYGSLLETAGQLQTVLDGIESGVVLVDEAGLVRYANRRLGYLLETEVAAWPGQPVAELLPPLLEPLAHPATVFGAELWQPRSHQRVLRRWQGPINDEAGKRLGTIEVWSDVTELEAANQLKDDFVAAAAHDLKTPVTAIKGYAQIALRAARKTEDQRLLQQLEMINLRSDDLTYLMDSLLDMSRLQGGRLTLDPSSFIANDLVRRVGSHFELDLQRRQRAITYDLPPEPLPVTWDRSRISRVLMNLMTNAIKYAPDGGDIAIALRPSSLPAMPDGVELTITDHGMGIAPEERDRIFERFYRTAQTLAEGFSGTGIGLFICYQIVSIHGGTMWAEDARHGGQGTTMVVLLPRTVPLATP